MREPKAKSRECFSWTSTHRTLVAVVSDVGPAFDIVSAEARVDEGVIDVSDALASDAGQTLCIVRWLHDDNDFFKPLCAPDAVASVDPPSDTSRERKSSLDAYWSASDARHRTLSARHQTHPVLIETTVDL
jgi:hypothetical protein